MGLPARTRTDNIAANIRMRMERRLSGEVSTGARHICRTTQGLRWLESLQLPGVQRLRRFIPQSFVSTYASSATRFAADPRPQPRKVTPQLRELHHVPTCLSSVPLTLARYYSTKSPCQGFFYTRHDVSVVRRQRSGSTVRHHMQKAKPIWWFYRTQVGGTSSDETLTLGGISCAPVLSRGMRHQKT
jgi:hypothetical protein